MYFSKVNSDMTHLTFNLIHNLFLAYAKMFLLSDALATMNTHCNVCHACCVCHRPSKTVSFYFGGSEHSYSFPVYR